MTAPEEQPKAPPTSPFGSTWSRWFFTACILFVLYLAYHLLEPFLVQVFLAVVLVVVAMPLYEATLNLMGGHRTLASAITCILLILIFAIPFFLVASLLTSQALDLYTTVSKLLASDKLETTFREGMGRLGPIIDQVQEKLGISHADVLQQVGNLVRKVSNLLYENFTSLLKGVTNLVIGVALVLFVTFYLFMDGAHMAAKVLSLSPLPKEMNSQIMNDMIRTLRATLKGSVVLAFINGTVSGLGFFAFGVPNALFWGTVMVFASVVPIVGTALVWVPAGLYLMIMGDYGQAIGVMIWCLIVSVICDNWLRPKLIGGQADLHPLLTFFAVLGGISYFGIVGLILGPLVLAILLSLVEVYRRYFLDSAPNQTEFCAEQGEKPPESPAQEGEQTE
jgi:predicted PurR-regulated permease PerM